MMLCNLLGLLLMAHAYPPKHEHFHYYGLYLVHEPVLYFPLQLDGVGVQSAKLCGT